MICANQQFKLDSLRPPLNRNVISWKLNERKRRSAIHIKALMAQPVATLPHLHGYRVELPSFLGTKVIPVSDIVNIEVRPPLVVGDLFRGKSLRYCWALKLDLADLCRHVALHRRSGIMKRIRFSPDDPEEFVRECMLAMNARSMR